MRQGWTSVVAVLLGLATAGRAQESAWDTPAVRLLRPVPMVRTKTGSDEGWAPTPAPGSPEGSNQRILARGAPPDPTDPSWAPSTNRFHWNPPPEMRAGSGPWNANKAPVVSAWRRVDEPSAPVRSAIVPTSWTSLSQPEVQLVDGSEPPVAHEEKGGSPTPPADPARFPDRFRMVPVVPSPPVPAGEPPVPPIPLAAAPTNLGTGPFPPFLGDGGPAHRWSFYGQAELLLWWTRGSSLPPLATTGPTGGGSLADPNTMVLIGNTTVASGLRPGGRFMIGTWLLDDHLLGFEVQGLFLGAHNQSFLADSGGAFPLYRPVRDATDGWKEIGAPGAGAPAGYAGAELARVTSSFWGLAAEVRSMLRYTPDFHLDGLLGYRTLGLNEDFTMSDSAAALDPGAIPTSRVIGDRIATRNQFHGPRVGAEAGWIWENWTFDVRGSLALGGNAESLDVSGLTVVRSAGNLQGFPVGLLAAPTNSGHFNRGVFSVVPEIGMRVGFRVTERLRMYLGYDLIYWTNVLRVASQIDRTITLDPSTNAPATAALTPNSGRPAVPFASSDFWAQGITFGMELKY